jgi:Tfp pilus assembly protein PilP
MRLAKTIATVFMVLGTALCFAGGALAQSNATVHKSEPQKATAKSGAAAPPKTSEKPAPKPAAKPALVASVKPIPKPASKTEPKLVAAKPAVEKLASAKAVNPKPANAKPASAKPVSSKPAIAKAAPKPVAKPIAPEVAAKDKPSVGIAASPDQAPAVSHADQTVAKRDPFIALVNVQKEGGGGPNLPPGKAGLVVATVRVDGTVKSGEELLAVVSNPERHVYFVREGDHLYDGSVKKIDLDGVTFQEDSKDAFGKPVVREVTKRIYASAGEQQ